MTVKRLLLVLGLVCALTVATTLVWLNWDRQPSQPDSNAPKADYLYYTQDDLVLMRGEQEVTRVRRLFDPADRTWSDLTWTHNGERVVVLSDTGLRREDPKNTELISINTRTGAQQRLPCPGCDDIIAVGQDSVLAFVNKTEPRNQDVRQFNLGSDDSAEDVDFPAPNAYSGHIRSFAASSGNLVLTRQGQGYGANGYRQQLTVAKPGSTKPRHNLGFPFDNTTDEVRAASNGSGDEAWFLVTAPQNPGQCNQQQPTYLFLPGGFKVTNDLSAAYPPGTKPGADSGIQVHDLWHEPSGSPEQSGWHATISSFTCTPREGDRRERALHSPPTVWKIGTGMTWVRTDSGPATMRRGIGADTRIVLDIPHCIGEPPNPDPAHCHTGKLFREQGGKRTQVAEGVISIATPPRSSGG